MARFKFHMRSGAIILGVDDPDVSVEALSEGVGRYLDKVDGFDGVIRFTIDNHDGNKVVINPAFVEFVAVVREAF